MKQKPVNSNNYKSSQAKAFASTSTSNEKCEICMKSHAIYYCDEFKKMTIHERFEKVKSLGYCFNCLKKGHKTGDCKSKHSCSFCKKRHNSLLHFHDLARPDIKDDNSNQVQPAVNENSETPKTSCHQFKRANHSANLSKQVLLLSYSCCSCL